MNTTSSRVSPETGEMAARYFERHHAEPTSQASRPLHVPMTHTRDSRACDAVDVEQNQRFTSNYANSLLSAEDFQIKELLDAYERTGNDGLRTEPLLLNNQTTGSEKTPIDALAGIASSALIWAWLANEGINQSRDLLGF